RGVDPPPAGRAPRQPAVGPRPCPPRPPRRRARLTPTAATVLQPSPAYRRATARRRAVPRTAVGRPPARRRPPRSAASTTSQHCEEAEMTVYAAPGTDGAIAEYEPRYDHWIGGEYVAPSSGQYFENPSPVTGRTFTEVARGNADDVERALDAAHGAARSWGRTSATER